MENAVFEFCNNSVSLSTCELKAQFSITFIAFSMSNSRQYYPKIIPLDNLHLQYQLSCWLNNELGHASGLKGFKSNP